MQIPRSVAALAVFILMPTVAACTGGSGSTASCGPIRREALDRQFLVHVIGNAKVQYSSNPPTSGAHQPTPSLSGVQAEPIPKPIQVGALEAGDILLQHRPDLPADQLRSLEALAGTGVAVSSADDLPAPGVATAWLFKRTCTKVDTAALRQFIAQRKGKGPGSDGP